MKWARLCSSLSIPSQFPSLGSEWNWPFPVLWSLMIFPNFLAHWVQHFNSIIVIVLIWNRSDQSLSRVQLFATPWIAARHASLSITNSRSSLRLSSIKSVMPSSHLILCCPLLLLPPILPASESFPMSQLFAWGGQSTGVLALASFLPKNTQG